MKVEHSEITVSKITRDVFEATCIILKPCRAEMSKKDRTEEIAKKKLELFLAEQPYKHLDNL